MRSIQIIGDISYKSYSVFAEQMAELELMPYEPIEIELVSGGGDAYVSLAYFSRIRRSICPVHITGSGIIASAAVLILAAGHQRFMTKEAWLMVHEETGEATGEVHFVERTVKHYRNMEIQCDKMLASVSKVSEKQWAAYHKCTTYFNAKDCLKMGLIEGIV